MNKPIITKKSLGQHWLEDEATLQEICSLAELERKDTVLEVGPGLGSLTRLLAGEAGQVIAVEIDDKLSDRLGSVVKIPNLSVVNENILKFDLSQLPPDYKLVANIPYYLTSKLLRMLSESNNPPVLVVLLVQKEVAEGVGAKPGAMSLLSVTTQFFWEVSLKQVVLAKMFTPSPKVNSQVILLKRRIQPLYPDIDDKAFFRLVKVGFSARRKTLLNSISGGLRLEKEKVEIMLKRSKIDPGARPQTLELNAWYAIYKVFSSEQII